MLITGFVMQYKAFCLLWEVGFGGCISYPSLCWGEDRNLFIVEFSFCLGQGTWDIWWHVFRCMFFMSFDVGFWDFHIGKFVNGVFMYSPSHFGCDGDEGVGLPCMVLYGVDKGVVFGVSMCEAWLGKLSWQYVNSVNWTVSVGEGDIGVCVWFGAPILHRNPWGRH